MVLDNATAERYQTHQEKLLTLYVTRKDQEFIVSNDLQLVDIELVRSSIELVGEPGYRGATGQGGAGGYVNNGRDYAANKAGTPADDDFNYAEHRGYMSTINTLYTGMNRGGSETSKLYGEEGTNQVTHLPHLNHGWANVEIKGMTDGSQFLRDDSFTDNSLSLIVPTDHGVLSVRSSQQNGPPTELRLERVKMQQKLRVDIQFAGSWPKNKRQARFVEDFADTDITTYRNNDGTVKLYPDTARSGCHIPSNMIVCAVLQFKIKPRTTL
tara:strand:+ start:2685 stop:3491 length:807 start_codon:yes stop_codon:yes gene_type:complete